MGERRAFLFPGQGQLPTAVLSPSPDFDLLWAAAEADGLDLRAWISSGDVARLARTDAAQPAVFLDSLARVAVLASHGIAPDVVAGHSLGEYAALVSAGVLRAEDALPLVVRRGRLMASVAGGMSAVVKLELAAVQTICDAVPDAVLANYNGERQFVLSAPLESLDEIGRRASALGGRAIRLDVSGPFHSPAMRPAEEALAPAIEAAAFATPRLAFVSSASGRREPDERALRQLLLRQITAPVRWTDVLRSLAGLGVTEAVEVAAGGVLTQLGKRAVDSIRFVTFEEALHG